MIWGKRQNELLLSLWCGLSPDHTMGNLLGKLKKMIYISQKNSLSHCECVSCFLAFHKKCETLCCHFTKK